MAVAALMGDCRTFGWASMQGQRANLKEAIMRENFGSGASGLGEFGTARHDAFMRERLARCKPRGDARR